MALRHGADGEASSQRAIRQRAISQRPAIAEPTVDQVGAPLDLAGQGQHLPLVQGRRVGVWGKAGAPDWDCGSIWGGG